MKRYEPVKVTDNWTGMVESENGPYVLHADAERCLSEGKFVEALHYYANAKNWNPVADYSDGYWYMAGRPWMLAVAALKDSGIDVDLTAPAAPESDPDEAFCADCGAHLELVRPGKHQHPDCPQAPRDPYAERLLYAADQFLVRLDASRYRNDEIADWDQLFDLNHIVNERRAAIPKGPDVELTAEQIEHVARTLENPPPMSIEMCERMRASVRKLHGLLNPPTGQSALSVCTSAPTPDAPQGYEMSMFASKDERLRAILRDHWLTGIECDHEAKTDVATCFCSVWRSEPQPNVRAAVERWIEHVLGATPPAGINP